MRIRFCLILALLLPLLALAQESEHNGQSLDQAAEDPTASLMALQVADWYTAAYHAPTSGSGNALVLRPVIPFQTGSLPNIFRATIPFITQSPGQDTGLGDITVFDLVVFPE